ncbi:hypothetical protein [Kaistia terrae]|uniref:Uncharacterized protein n=1 Tax=Kaistia terrae TaxID=537017 RepID=A0ABW0Q3M1_9HYPH|nr:hypothetical protein [Kaistia terrae]MCX5581450.1 hypothetical protein [Kaistia terrae]
MADRIEDGGSADVGRDLVDKLTVKAAMINLGEKIDWGSETDLMHEAAAEIIRLRALVTSSEQDRYRVCAELVLQLEQARAENAGMLEALEFYGDETAWNQPPVKTHAGLLGIEYENQASKVQKDRGRLARAAISRARQIGLSVGRAEA